MTERTIEQAEAELDDLLTAKLTVRTETHELIIADAWILPDGNAVTV